MRRRSVPIGLGAAAIAVAAAVVATVATTGEDDDSPRDAAPGRTLPAGTTSGGAAAGTSGPEEGPESERIGSALAATAGCLEREGADVVPLPRADERRTQLADLAQGASIEVRFGDRWVAFGFTREPRQAELLAELLTVPDDPYVVRVEGSVVAMYPPNAGPEAAAARACLIATR